MTVIPAHELPLIEPYVGEGVSVLEFGDKRNPSGLYRRWYEAKGATYTCIDINGRNGALPLDVREPFNVGRHDLVTNFGFSEHVSVQQPFWANAYRATRVGGAFVGTVPQPHNWVGHGWSYWHPSKRFLRMWSDLNGMEIVTIHECGPGDPAKLMWGYAMIRRDTTDHVWTAELDDELWRNEQWPIPDDKTVFYGRA